MTDTYVITPAARARREARILNGGGNRGALANIAALAQFNRDSQGAEVIPRYVDIAPGRAVSIARVAERAGVSAQAFEGRIEDALAARDMPPDAPLVLNVDRATSVASALRAVRSSPRPVLAYLLLRMPAGRLWALRMAIAAGDVASLDLGTAFADGIARASERGGSASIFGGGADPAHLLIEPSIRAWFAAHTAENLAKMIAGTEPASATFEITSNSRDTLPLHVVARERWSEPAELAQHVVEHGESPVRRGSSLAVAEVTPDGVRIHEVRRRTDGRTAVADSGAAAREAAIVRAERTSNARPSGERRESSRGEGAALALLAVGITAALSRAERDTASRSNPVLTTD